MRTGPGKFCRCILYAIAAISLLRTEQVSAQNQSWDTSFIPKDTFFHVGINVEGLLALEPEDSELRKELAAAIKEQSHINIEEMRQIQFLMGGEEAESDGDAFQIKMVFNEPQDWQPLIDNMFGGIEMVATESNGKKYFQATFEHTPSIYPADDKTIIVAKETRLLELMKSESGKGFIVDKLAEAEGNAHAFIAFEYNDQCDKFMQELGEELRGIPFDLHDIVSEAKSGTATLMLDSDELLIANIVAGDKEGAERLQRASEALVALGKVGIPQARKQMEAFPDLGEARMKSVVAKMIEESENGLDVAEAVIDGTSVKVDGNTVEIKSNVSGGAVEGARSFARMILFGMSMQSELIDEPTPID